jgi:hypothetical protein
MSAIKLSTPSSGSISLSPANTASNLTITVPAVTGTMAIQGAAFSAYRSSSAQTVTSGVVTKVALNAEEFDTANCFDSTTNYRFTPTVAGYYQVNGAIGMSASSISLAIIQIYKNGSEFKRGNDLRTTLGTDCNPVVSSLIYMNGTTDYLELYGYVSGTGTCLFNSVQTSTYFQASMVRAT